MGRLSSTLVQPGRLAQDARLCSSWVRPRSFCSAGRGERLARETYVPRHQPASRAAAVAPAPQENQGVYSTLIALTLIIQIINPVSSETPANGSTTGQPNSSSRTKNHANPEKFSNRVMIQKQRQNQAGEWGKRFRPTLNVSATATRQMYQASARHRTK